MSAPHPIVLKNSALAVPPKPGPRKVEDRPIAATCLCPGGGIDGQSWNFISCCAAFDQRRGRWRTFSTEYTQLQPFSTDMASAGTGRWYGRPIADTSLSRSRCYGLHEAGGMMRKSRAYALCGGMFALIAIRAVTRHDEMLPVIVCFVVAVVCALRARSEWDREHVYRLP